MGQREYIHSATITPAVFVDPQFIRTVCILDLVFLSGACLVERSKIHGENHRAMPTSNSHNVVGTIVWHVDLQICLYTLTANN